MPRIALRPVFALLAGALACETTPAEPDAWALVRKGDPGALLSVWGTAADDVWAVGGDVGGGPAVLHHDGAGFRELATGASGTLWWVAGVGDSVWMSGDGGLVLRYDRADGTFEPVPPPTQERFYGILPFADDDVWVVGSNDTNTAGAIYHYDGSAWSVPDGLPDGLTDSLAFFKIWGESSDDLWVVGYGGKILHRTGGAWDTLDVPGGSPLFTVHGRGDTVLAVGGAFSGTLLDLGGGAATEVTPEGEVLQLNGVHVGAKATVAVGAEGSVWRRAADGAWTQDADAPKNPLDYHAAYVDPDGGVWAVGGRVIDDPPVDGVLAHYGQPLAGTEE